MSSKCFSEKQKEKTWHRTFASENKRKGHLKLTFNVEAPWHILFI